MSKFKDAGAMFTSKSDEWATPDDLFRELDAEFHFDLDPCATDENHKCDDYYTKEQNGLDFFGGVGRSSLTHLIPKSKTGLRSHSMKRSTITQRLLCCCLHGRTRSTSTTTSCIEQRSGSLKEDSGSADQRQQHRSRQC